MPGAIYNFSIGGLHGWHGALLGLAGSLVFLVAGRQDVRPGIGMISSAFWFLLAMVSVGGVIWLGVVDRIWGAASLGATIFCSEVWLIQRWWQVRGKQVEKRQT